MDTGLQAFVDDIKAVAEALECTGAQAVGVVLDYYGQVAVNPAWLERISPAAKEPAKRTLSEHEIGVAFMEAHS